MGNEGRRLSLQLVLVLTGLFASQYPALAQIPNVGAEVAVLCENLDLGGSESPGLAFNEAAREVVLIQPLRNALLFVDVETCTATRELPLAPRGIDGAVALSYDELRDELVVGNLQTETDSIIYLDYEQGQVLGRCDLDPLGVRDPIGVTAVPLLGATAIAGGVDRSLALIDRSCALVSHFSLALALPGEADGLAFDAAGARFLSTNGADLLQGLGFQGEPLFTLDPAVLGLDVVSALARTSTPGVFLALRSRRNEPATIVEVTVAALASATDISGTYERGPLRLLVLGRADGNLSGALRLPLATSPVFGFYEADTRALNFVLRLPNGTALTLEGSFTEDGQQLVLPAPLGTFTRQQSR